MYRVHEPAVQGTDHLDAYRSLRQPPLRYDVNGAAAPVGISYQYGNAEGSTHVPPYEPNNLPSRCANNMYGDVSEAVNPERAKLVAV